VPGSLTADTTGSAVFRAEALVWEVGVATGSRGAANRAGHESPGTNDAGEDRLAGVPTLH
jgi:hypothetical protein